MTDARFPERWLNDRRVIRLTDGAFRLFVVSLTWSVSNRTDGAIESADLSLMLGADRRNAGELLKAGLWTSDTERGVWTIADFVATQTTADQLVVLENARARERRKKARRRGRDNDDDDEPPGLSPGMPSPGLTQDRPGQDRPRRQGQGEGDHSGTGDEHDDRTDHAYHGGPVEWDTGRQLRAVSGDSYAPDDSWPAAAALYERET